ncbi:unnamed protein product, partial [Symbiodinium microadriaticum]
MGSGSGFLVPGFGFWFSVRGCRCCFFLRSGTRTRFCFLETDFFQEEHVDVSVFETQTKQGVKAYEARHTHLADLSRRRWRRTVRIRAEGFLAGLKRTYEVRPFGFHAMVTIVAADTGSDFTREVVGFERLKELQMLAQGTLRSKIDYGDHVWKVATHWTNEIQNVTVHKFTLQQMPGPPKQDQTWYTWLHGTDHSGVSVFLLRQGELYLQTSRKEYDNLIPAPLTSPECPGPFFSCAGLQRCRADLLEALKKGLEAEHRDALVYHPFDNDLCFKQKPPGESRGAIDRKGKAGYN